MHDDWSQPYDVLPVIDRAYGVIDGSAAWTDCLDLLTELTGFDACGLFRHDCISDSVALIASCGLDGGPSSTDCTIVGSAAGFLEEVMLRSAPGAVWLEADLRERFELRDSAVWRDWIGPRNFQTWGCGVVERDHRLIIYIEFLGRRERGPIGGNTLRLLHRVLPHLRRACKLASMLSNDPLSELRPPAASSGRPGMNNIPFEARLRMQFKLTKAEARVAAHLAQGLSLKAIADRLHVSIHTVRSQLQAIYQKTDTCRQAELASLLLRDADLTGHDDRQVMRLERLA